MGKSHMIKHEQKHKTLESRIFCGGIQNLPIELEKRFKGTR